MQVAFESIVEAYKRRGLLLLLSVIVSLFGLFTAMKYQSIVIPSFSDFLEALNKDGKSVVITFTLNLFSAALLLSVAVSWIIGAFKPSDFSDYSYRYDDSSTSIINIATYIITGVALLIFSFVFISYIFNKILIVLIVGVVGTIALYGNANKR